MNKPKRILRFQGDHTKQAPYLGALLLALAFLPALSGCGKKNAAAQAAAPVFAVNTSTAVEGQIWDYIALSGDIVAGTTVDVYSDVAGKVSRIYVDVGSAVGRDAPVAAVDPSKPGMTYVPGIARAPISGTVVSLPAQMGMTVSQAVPLARIAGSGSNALEIKLYVAERFISKMALALPCIITLDAYPGESFRGSISELSPVLDPSSRTMEVKVNVENPGSRLKAGMFAKVRVITEQKEGIVKVPASALVERFGETYVFVVEELPPDPAQEKAAEEKKGFFASLFGRKDTAEAKMPEAPAKRYAARKRIVTPGILIDGVLEVQSGLGPNEEFIVRGQTLLEDGARVNVIDRVAPLRAEH